MGLTHINAFILQSTRKKFVLVAPIKQQIMTYFFFYLYYSFIRKSINHGYKPTIGADFNSKKLLMPVGDELVSVTLQLWDTAGQERYQSLGAAFYRGAEACILVFDITNPDSFDNLENWRSNFLEKCMPKDPHNFPFFVFGNKKDLEADRLVRSN